MAEMKICTQCKNEKQENEFEKHRHKCRECRKQDKKAYNDTHKEENREWKRLNTNKELANHNKRIAYEKSEQVKCDCGGSYKIIDKWRHDKTVKHQDFLKMGLRNLK